MPNGGPRDGFFLSYPHDGFLYSAVSNKETNEWILVLSLL